MTAPTDTSRSLALPRVSALRRDRRRGADGTLQAGHDAAPDAGSPGAPAAGGSPANDPRERGVLAALARTGRGLRARPELLGLLALAAVLNLWGLSQNGTANAYYAAAVRAMASDWHAFLYGSFDAAGIMTVDKPPLASWVQALSVRAFGFSSLAILVPQALMGVAATALVHDLVRRPFGRAAAALAGLFFVLTPVTAAIFRHNNPDALLVLTAVGAVWTLVRALETGRTRWLVWTGVLVGLGFETKMAAALLIVPAIAAAYLWVAPRGRLRALGQLSLGGVAMVVVGGAWPLLLALTPAADRPWVSGTNDNSVWSLILGYNGLGRLVGQDGGPGGMAGGPGGGGGMGGVFGGSPGATRLLDASLGGQVGWLLGLSVIGGLAILLRSRLRRADPRAGWIIAVGGAFLTSAVAFSTASGIFHPYYVSYLAPFAAALAGAGLAQLAGTGRLVRVLAPIGVLAGVLTSVLVLQRTEDTGGLDGWAPALAVLGVLVATGLVATSAARVRTALLGAAAALLLLAPAAWSVQTLGHATQGTFPAGGPESGMGGPGGGRGPGGPGGGFPGGSPGTGAGARGGLPGAGTGTAGAVGGGRSSGRGAAGGGPGGMFGGNTQGLEQAIAYARSHGGGTVVVSSQSGAASSIIGSGADVAGIGGFSGRESAVSASWLADAVQDGRIRWLLGGSEAGGGMRDGRTGSTAVLAKVAEVCAPVSLGDGSASASGESAGSSSSSSGTVLYDCAGKAAALRAS